MNRSDSIAKLATALVAVQAELPTVTKDRDNPHFRHKYVTLDAIITTIRPVLAKHKLAVVQSTEALPESTTVQVTTTLFHESGEWLSTTVPIPVVKQDAQGVGSAITYGRRYGLGAFLSIATDEDDDANAAVKRKSANVRQSSKALARDENDHDHAVEDSGEHPITPDSLWPFGKHKGKKVADLPIDALRWAIGDGRKFGARTEEWQDAARIALDDLENAFPAAIKDTPDDLPFT